MARTKGSKNKTKKVFDQKEQKEIIKRGLELMGDQEDQEIALSLCDEELIWRLHSYNKRATQILFEMKTLIVLGPVAPYYKLEPDQLIMFLKRYHKQPNIISEEHLNKLKNNLEIANLTNPNH